MWETLKLAWLIAFCYFGLYLALQIVYAMLKKGLNVVMFFVYTKLCDSRLGLLYRHFCVLQLFRKAADINRDGEYSKEFTVLAFGSELIGLELENKEGYVLKKLSTYIEGENNKVNLVLAKLLRVRLRQLSGLCKED